MNKTSSDFPIGPCASAYCWPDKILVHAAARIEPGFYVHAGPWLTMLSDVPHATLGSAVREALLAFRPSVPVPDYRSEAWKAVRLAKLSAVGVRSDRQFMKGSKSVWIETIGQRLVLTPNRNGGSTGSDRGYHGLVEERIEAPLAIDVEGLGRKLSEAWARCT